MLLEFWKVHGCFIYLNELLDHDDRVENSCAHSVGITMVCTNVRSASAGIFIVRDVSSNNIYLIHYIKFRCVHYMW